MQCDPCWATRLKHQPGCALSCFLAVRESPPRDIRKEKLLQRIACEIEVTCGDCRGFGLTCSVDGLGFAPEEPLRPRFVGKRDREPCAVLSVPRHATNLASARERRISPVVIKQRALSGERGLNRGARLTGPSCERHRIACGGDGGGLVAQS